MNTPPSFTVDTTLAASAGNGNSRINTSGAYTGIITKAKYVTSSRTGAQGIEFDFKSEAGQTANMMTLWIADANGKTYDGFKGIVDSMAFLMKQNAYSPAQVRVTEYDFAEGQEVTRQVWAYPALMGKPIGLVLQAEEYAKNNGDTGTRMNIVRAFGAASRMTVSEITSKAEKATAIDAMLLTLKDKKINQDRQAPAIVGRGQYAEKFDDFDDDIPF
jgi:hypothetical protein